MAYDKQLADRVREYLVQFPKLKIEEKKMFQGLAFLVNGKMCVNVSGQNLMCRFDPAQTENLSDKTGFLPMIMNRKRYKGYCYVEPEGFRSQQEFKFWIDLCIDYNDKVFVACAAHEMKTQATPGGDSIAETDQLMFRTPF